MVPIPPGKRGEPVRDRFRKPFSDRARWIAGDDGIGGHVLGHDRAGRDHRAGGDATARQDDRAMADPDVMADIDVMLAPPVEEFGLVLFTFEIGAGAVDENAPARRGASDDCRG